MLFKTLFCLSLVLLASSFKPGDIIKEAERDLELLSKNEHVLKMVDLIVEVIDHMESTADKFVKSHNLYHLLNTIRDIGQNKTCGICTDFFTKVNQTGSSALSLDVLTPLIMPACTAKKGEQICIQAIQNYGNVTLEILSDKLFNPQRACANLLLCPRGWEKESLIEYVDEILADKPDIPIPKPTGRATYQALHVSDLHVDVFYETGANAQCDYITCCRQDSGPAPTPETAAGYWATPDSPDCDIPMRTVEQFLQFVARNFDIDIIIWTGDNIAHDDFYESPFNKTLQSFLISQNMDKYLVNASSGIKVYPIHGNHEGSPVNLFDYAHNTTAWLTDQLSTIWSEYLGSDAQEELKNYGYYAQYNEEKNLRVIALDTQACNTDNFYLLENPTDPYGQLAFIREQLYHAEANNESVYFLGHIPINNGNCDYTWSVRFNALVDRFAHVIRGQFYGHTHSDDYAIMRGIYDDEPVGVEFIVPAMTTKPFHYPSFRIYEMDVDTNFIVDYHQYHLNATKWNTNTTGPIDWDLFYSFVEAYQVPDMTFETIDALTDRFLEDPDLVADYIYHQNTGYSPKYYLSEDDTVHTYCGCKTGTTLAYILCLGPDYANSGDVLSNVMEDDALGSWRQNK